MTSLPSMYDYLNGNKPRMTEEALKLYGTHELLGSESNQTILSWATEVEHAIGVQHLSYTTDSIPWCGLFMALVAVRASWSDQVPKTPLWARSWLTFGVEAEKPSLGDILVFGREGGGHVSQYVGEDQFYFHILGGNQGDAVNIIRIPKTRLLPHGVRRPKWKVAQPVSVKPIHLGPNGPISINEA